MADSFFGTESVKVVTLPDWMQWASGQAEAARRVVLPMIQRGSVWAPHKLLDLWDTLLRGMPVGALMACETAPLSTVMVPGQAGTRLSKTGDIDLIDGQQRTLSMLAGWPDGLKNPTRPVSVWADLTDTPQGEYRFRLWATTKAQPFGYSRASMGGQPLGKLDRSKLRLANKAWQKLDAQALWKLPDFMPWEAKFALPLTELMNNKDRLSAFLAERLASYKQALAEKIKPSTGDAGTPDKDSSANALTHHWTSKLNALPSEEDLIKSVPTIQAALQKVHACQFPVIHVQRESFEDQHTGAGDINTDPPLAILFKRVGTGGEELSNADYVYSVIKHYVPEVHGTVEALLKDEKVSALYTPTTLVMSAVRLAMLTLKTEDAKAPKITDTARLDKAAFARLVRNHPGFIEHFHDAIKPGGAFASRLKTVLENMSYSPSGFHEGLPKHALSLMPIPLLEVILAWHALMRPSAEATEQSRLPMVRFVLQGHLCVNDYAKASEVAIKALQNSSLTANADTFPGQALMAVLSSTEHGLAYPLPSPATLQAISGLTVTPSDIQGLRGRTRFNVETEDSAVRQHVEIYKRWWNRKGGHVHPMLLWLQRDYVYKAFEQQPALAGMDEETPFDFDHILPSAQWSYWTGASARNRLIDFPVKDGKGNEDKTGHWYNGNSIGNIHVLESGENRSLGDASVRVKLANDDFAKNAQIQDSSKASWLAASGEEDKPRHWAKTRALDFQKAVEQRTFELYTKFYQDLFPEASARTEVAPVSHTP